MIIEDKKEISEPVSNTKIKTVGAVVLLILMVASCIAGIYAKAAVSAGLFVFAGTCAIALHILLTFFKFWKQHPWKAAFTPGIIFLIWLPAIFGISKLRSGYEKGLLAREGMVTYGRVTEVFKERSGRRWNKYKLVARLEFHAGHKILSRTTGNPGHYLNVDDTIELVYAATDPDVFRVVAVKKFKAPYLQGKTSQVYQPVLGNVLAQPPVTKINSPPQFKGGMEGFAKYLRNALQYPAEAYDKHVAGKVYLSFVIQEDGSVADVVVVRGLGYGCDEAAVKAIRNSPAWLPGIQNGKAVRVKYNLPVSFSMQ
jgi:protein TonB